MLNRYAKKRIGGSISEEEINDYKDYLKHVLLKPGSTEYALFVCFDHYFFAKLPLDDESVLVNLNLPISFVYGDRDWMARVGTHDALRKNPYLGTQSKRYTLPDSDHHLYFDNPEGLIEIMLEDLSTLPSKMKPESSQIQVLVSPQDGIHEAQEEESKSQLH